MGFGLDTDPILLGCRGKPLANCQLEKEVSTLWSGTQGSSVWPRNETLISDATLLSFVQGQLFHISQQSAAQTLAPALITVAAYNAAG